MRTRALIAAAVIGCAAHGLGAPARAAAQTISSNPHAYRVWMRHEIDKDLAELYRVASDLVGALDPKAPGDRREAADWAGEVVDLAHDVWKNVQLRKPNRERPKRDPALKPRPLSEARADADEVRALVRSVARDLAAERRTRQVDVRRRVALLEKLERIERIGHQLEVDLKPQR